MVDHTNLLDLMEMYLTDCQLRKLSPKTLEGYRKLLQPMLIWLGDNEQVDTIGDLVPQHYKMYLMYTKGISTREISLLIRQPLRMTRSRMKLPLL